jgi:hypothetical protein
MKPIFALMSLVLLGVGLYQSPAYQTILYTVYNISYTLALYQLGLIYMVSLILKGTKERIGVRNQSSKNRSSFFAVCKRAI